MSVARLDDAVAVSGGQDSAPACIPVGRGQVVFYSKAAPGGNGVNQDALAVCGCGAGRAVLVVADGFGGLPAGDQAAQLAVGAILGSVEGCLNDDRELRDGILDGFEEANRAVTALGVGAATTLAVAEIDGETVRPYHVGDSEILIVGQRGRVRLQTLSHSPVAYGVEAGLIDREEAIHHAERNVVSNMVGSAEMRIEIGAHMAMHARDTLLLATDGVFDNLGLDELVEIIRKGPIEAACGRLARRCAARMTEPGPGEPSKPDDVSIIMFRPLPGHVGAREERSR